MDYNWLPTKTASGEIVSFESELAAPLQDLKVAIEPQQSGSGDPSPTNVRAISGWDSVDVNVCRKNLLKSTSTLNPYSDNGITWTPNSDGSVSVRGTATANATYINGNWMKVFKLSAVIGQQYTISGADSSGLRMRLGVGESASYVSVLTSSYTFTATDTVYYIGLNVPNGATVDGVIKPMARLASDTDSTYEPYNGNTTTVALGQTVYGGSLNVTTGVLTVDRAMVDLGTLTWTRNTSDYSYAYFYSNGFLQFSQIPLVCSHYPFSSGGKAGLTTDKTIAYYSASSTRMTIRDDSYTDATSFKTAMSGVQCVYFLLNPQTYQLTPTQVQTLLGQNNVWADSGEVEVTYSVVPNEGMIYFNGHSSDEFGIRVERFPDLNRSARKFKSASVSGRNGNIYQMQDAWEEVVVSYQIFAGRRKKGAAVPAFTDIVEWLHSADGYAELSDSYDYDHYRLGVFVDDMDIESQWHQFGRATIKFRCRPERYIVETPATLTNPMTINNPTNHIAHPVLELAGSGYANLVRIDGRTNVLGIEDYADAGYFTRLPAGCETEGYRGCCVTPNGNRIPNTGDQTTAGTYTAGQVTYSAAANYGIGLPMAVLPQTEYSLSFKTSKTGSNDAVLSTVYFFDSFGNYISRYLTKSTAYSAGVQTTFNFTTPVECGYIVLVVSGATNATTYTIRDIMLNYGLTERTYSAYASFTATVKINDITMQINQKFSKAVIDCENETLTIEGQRANPASVLLDKDGFPSAEYLHLKSGNNSYSFTNVSSGTITKRFWEL